MLRGLVQVIIETKAMDGSLPLEAAAEEEKTA